MSLYLSRIELKEFTAKCTSAHLTAHDITGIRIGEACTSGSATWRDISFIDSSGSTVLSVTAFGKTPPIVIGEGPTPTEPPCDLPPSDCDF